MPGHYYTLLDQKTKTKNVYGVDSHEPFDVVCTWLRENERLKPMPSRSAIPHERSFLCGVRIRTLGQAALPDSASARVKQVKGFIFLNSTTACHSDLYPRPSSSSPSEPFPHQQFPHACHNVAARPRPFHFVHVIAIRDPPRWHNGY